MDLCLITILIVVVIVILFVILLIKFGSRKQFFCSIPNRYEMSYRQEVLNKLNNQGYLIKEKENGHIFVQKDTFSATTLVLEQNGQNVNVYFIHTNSKALLAILIVCILTIWIVALILALIADSNSKRFRNEELKPLLCGYGTGRNCPNCGRPIPMEARFCPYCEKSFG